MPKIKKLLIKRSFLQKLKYNLFNYYGQIRLPLTVCVPAVPTEQTTLVK